MYQSLNDLCVSHVWHLPPPALGKQGREHPPPYTSVPAITLSTWACVGSNVASCYSWRNRRWENLGNLPKVTVYTGPCQDSNLKPILFLQLYLPSVWQTLLDASETKISAKKTTTKTVPFRHKTGNDSSPTLATRGSQRPNIKDPLEKTY